MENRLECTIPSCSRTKCGLLNLAFACQVATLASLASPIEGTVYVGVSWKNVCPKP